MKKSEIRTSRLMEMLQLNKRLGVKTVADTLGVSVATVRRLLARLESEGKVIRTHGGARLSPHLGTDYSYYVSSTHRSREKALIGRAAAETVVGGDRLFLDSGTTVLKLAEALSLRLQAGTLKNVVVITNSLALVEALARWCKVLLVGGEVRVERRDVWGPITEETLRQFRVSKAFLGADAVHISSGFMTTDESTAKMNEIVLRNSSHAFVLADSEKFTRDSFVRYAALTEAETIFTDPGIPLDVLQGFRDAGARVVVVPAAPRHLGRAAD
ncbi:MAG TPA: DeoR/GlpR family DNA-binding transcription regulator [Spirochaetia bacterium]|nr:DeoR/GlpR family DNA-binding transcription regulator [Spirochaetia bacterium]